MAACGVDVPLTTLFHGFLVQWEGVSVVVVVAASSGRGEGLCGCDWEQVWGLLLEGSMIIIINYNFLSINCNSTSPV